MVFPNRRKYLGGTNQYNCWSIEASKASIKLIKGAEIRDAPCKMTASVGISVKELGGGSDSLPFPFLSPPFLSLPFLPPFPFRLPRREAAPPPKPS